MTVVYVVNDKMIWVLFSYDRVPHLQAKAYFDGVRLGSFGAVQYDYLITTAVIWIGILWVNVIGLSSVYFGKLSNWFKRTAPPLRIQKVHARL